MPNSESLLDGVGGVASGVDKALSRRIGRTFVTRGSQPSRGRAKARQRLRRIVVELAGLIP
jgi:hypothetical protein